MFEAANFKDSKLRFEKKLIARSLNVTRGLT